MYVRLGIFLFLSGNSIFKFNFLVGKDESLTILPLHQLFWLSSYSNTYNFPMRFVDWNIFCYKKGFQNLFILGKQSKVLHIKKSHLRSRKISTYLMFYTYMVLYNFIRKSNATSKMCRSSLHYRDAASSKNIGGKNMPPTPLS